MTTDELIFVLLTPIEPYFAALLILAGVYSLTLNVSDARKRHHPRSEKLARIGGWLYIAGGIAAALKPLF